MSEPTTEVPHKFTSLSLRDSIIEECAREVQAAGRAYMQMQKECPEMGSTEVDPNDGMTYCEKMYDASDVFADDVRKLIPAYVDMHNRNRAKVKAWQQSIDTDAPLPLPKDIERWSPT